MRKINYIMLSNRNLLPKSVFVIFIIDIRVAKVIIRKYKILKIMLFSKIKLFIKDNIKLAKNTINKNISKFVKKLNK